MDNIIKFANAVSTFASQHPVLFTIFVVWIICISVVIYLLATANEGYEDPMTGYNEGPQPGNALNEN
jgi:hypothetical protein